MKLPPTEIEALYKFTERHFVEHYDVQTELVDHLANAIEEKLEASPNLNFAKALDEVYLGFGAMGFSVFVDEKVSQVQLKGFRLYAKCFKAYFKLPKIIFLITLFASLSFLFSKVSFDFMRITLFGTFFLLIGILVKNYFQEKNECEPC